MSHSLGLRPRALAEIEAARETYEVVEHGETFLAELETVLEAVQAMPVRFPIIYSTVHRVLLRHWDQEVSALGRVALECRMRTPCRTGRLPL